MSERFTVKPLTQDNPLTKFGLRFFVVDTQICGKVIGFSYTIEHAELLAQALNALPNNTRSKVQYEQPTLPAI